MSEKKEKRKLSVFSRIVIALLIILVLIVGVAFLNSKKYLDEQEKIELPSDKDLGITETTAKNLTGYRNIAIFGVDSRSDDYGVGNRSDCIIIASINNETGAIKLISVYRDTYLNITGRGLDKVTHAYSYGGPSLAMSTLNTNLDLDITEFVAVNFDAVIETVDAVGGVSIKIEPEEIQYINQYIDGLGKEIGKNSSHITTAGTHNLDGVQALAYSRIRYTSGGDYKRTERMRDVLMAVFEKAKKMNVGQLNNLANTILPAVYTNISSTEILSLVPQVASYSVSDSIGWPYEVKGITLDRWYGVPVDLEANVSKLHEALFDETDYQPSEAVTSISNSIIKKTGYR